MNHRLRRLFAALVVVVTAGVAGACGPTNLHVAPVKIEPIHMQIDVTLHDGDAAADPAQPAHK